MRGLGAGWAGAAVVAAACGSADDVANEPAVCDAKVLARAATLRPAGKQLVEIAGDLLEQQRQACVGLAVGFGGEVAADADVLDACEAFKQAMKAFMQAGHSFPIIGVDGRCTRDAEAQLACEVACVSGECDLGSVETRCAPGELAVVCEGECPAGATCEGTLAAPASCSGTCSGTCEGSCSGDCYGVCDGNCTGTCDDKASSGACAGRCVGTCDARCRGQCDGRCDGTCTEYCELAADAQLACGAGLMCKGGCIGAASAAVCEDELLLPACDFDAACETGCVGLAAFGADCGTFKVSVVADDAAVRVALEKHLPAVFLVASYMELVFRAWPDVVEELGTLKSGVAKDASCQAALGDLGPELQAATDAVSALAQIVGILSVPATE